MYLWFVMNYFRMKSVIRLLLGYLSYENQLEQIVRKIETVVLRMGKNCF